MKKLVVMMISAMSLCAFASTITVSGKGTVRARPDLVQLSFEVSTLNKEMDQGFAQLKAKNEAVGAALKAIGVKESEIKVSNIRMNPEHTYGSARGRTFEGYKQTCSFVISIPLDMDRVQTIFKTIVGTKASEDISMNFLIKDEKPYRTEAKKKAVKDAMETAATLAEAGGLTLGKVEEISYGAPSVTPLRRNGMMLAKAAAYSIESDDGMGMASSEVDDIILTESVTMIFSDGEDK